MALIRSVLASALALAVAPAAAQQFSQTVYFGDSLTDSGHFRPALIQAAGPSGALLGKFTTNPGLVWSEYLADHLGTQAISDNQGGTNYAVGGARSGVDGSGSLGPIPSVSTQVGRYLAASGGHADPNALYTLWAGNNDVFAALATAGAGGNPAPIISAAVTSEIGAIAALQFAGARYVLVPTIPDIGLTPGFRAQGPAAQAGATQLSSAYNNALFTGLGIAGFRVIPMDTFHLFQEIVANPAQFGFSNITGTACQPQITAQSLTCNPGTYVSADAPNTYAFADGVHPTTSGYKIVADYAASLLEAPQWGSVMTNSVAMTGRARAERVGAQASAPGDTDGMRGWADVRGDFQRYSQGDFYDGVGPALTVGVDWRSGSYVFGGFAGAARSDLDIGMHRGNFKQKEATLGAYVGMRAERAWINAQVSYTRLGFDVERRVQLGRAERMHQGSPDGSNVSAGVQGGWEFGDGALHHGPVLSLLSQTISVDAYNEDQPTLSTSLAYSEQKFDSLLGSAGWQVSYAVTEGLTPYARATIDREFEDMPAENFARLQSLPVTATYAVPGAKFDNRYGTLLLGARTTLFGFDANLGTSVTVGQQGGNHATVFATVSAAF